MFNYYHFTSLVIVSLMYSVLHAKVINMHISPNDVGNCNNGLVEDVENFFITATVELERKVQMADYVIFEIAEESSNEFLHYFDFNLLYKCNGRSLEDETLYCNETEPNVYRISKTERLTDGIKGAKVRGFIAGKDGNKYCEEQLVPEKFNASQKEPVLIINGEKNIIDEHTSNINTTIHDLNLSLEFTHEPFAKPCDIKIMVNGIPKNHTKGSHASYKISIEERSIVNLTITIICNECRKTEGKRTITCLIEHVPNKSLSQTTLIKTTTEKENEENKQRRNTLPYPLIITVMVVAALVFLVVVVLLTRFCYRKKMHTKREATNIQKDDFGPDNTVQIVPITIATSSVHDPDKNYEKDTTKIGDNNICIDEQLSTKSEINSLLSGTPCEKKDWVKLYNEC